MGLGGDGNECRVGRWKVGEEFHLRIIYQSNIIKYRSIYDSRLMNIDIMNKGRDGHVFKLEIHKVSGW